MTAITIIGTGNMARAIASRAIAAGIQVQLLAHEDKAKADALSSDLGGQVSTGVAGGAKVVKAFNTTFAGTLTGGQVAGQQLDVLIAGDDELAVKAVSDFAAAGGLNPIVVGPQVPPRRLKPGEQKPGPPLRSSSGPHEVGHVCDQSRRPRLHLFEFQWRDALKQPRAGAER